MNTIKTAIAKACTTSVLLFASAVLFLAVMHSIAFEDRLSLIIYYLGAICAAFVLVRRQEFAFASMIVVVLAGTLFARLFFSATPVVWNPAIDIARDLLGLSALMYFTARLVMISYSKQKEERQRQIQDEFENQIIAMRAEALRQTSHEVRTPLSTITAISETLLDGSSGDLSDDQKAFVTDIDDAARHLLDLVNDILDYAKAEAGMIRIAPEAVELADIVRLCVSIVTPKANSRGVTVRAVIDPTLEGIIADPLRIRQILINLLSNAVKYNSEGGHVAIRIAPDGDNYRISVTDTGRGIAPEHMEHLFEPYYQAAIADQGIGTGLGLAVIKHLVELHGGSIHVNSIVAVGTTFTVVLPQKVEAPTGSAIYESNYDLPTATTPQSAASEKLVSA